MDYLIMAHELAVPLAGARGDGETATPWRRIRSMRIGPYSSHERVIEL